MLTCKSETRVVNLAPTLLHFRGTPIIRTIGIVPSPGISVSTVSWHKVINSRRRDDPIIQVVTAEHSNLAANLMCASRGQGPCSPVVLLLSTKGRDPWHKFRERPQGVQGPMFQDRRQTIVHVGPLAVHLNFDELLEEFERPEVRVIITVSRAIAGCSKVVLQVTLRTTYRS